MGTREAFPPDFHPGLLDNFSLILFPFIKRQSHSGVNFKKELYFILASVFEFVKETENEQTL